MIAMTRDELEQFMIRPPVTVAEEIAWRNRTDLQVAADGLTPEQVAHALRMAGVDPEAGLGGVPGAREGMALSFLRAMPRRS